MKYTEQCKINFTNIIGGDIPDSEYFKVKALSTSSLKLINPKEGGSPETYLQGFDNSYNASLELGSAVHAIVLQPEDYKISDYKNKPSGKMGLFFDLLYKYRNPKDPKKRLNIEEAMEKASKNADYYQKTFMKSKKIKQKAITSGLDYYLRKVKGEFNDPEKEVIVLPERVLKTAKKCIRSVLSNQKVKTMFDQSDPINEKIIYNEMAVIACMDVSLPNVAEPIKLKIKGKLDNTVIEKEKNLITINDLKTTSKGLMYFQDVVVDDIAYSGAFGQHCYYRQAAIYTFLMQMFAEKRLSMKNVRMKYNNIVVETTGDLKTDVFPVNNSYIKEGIEEFKDLVCRVAYHEKYGYDKQYPDDTNDL